MPTAIHDCVLTRGNPFKPGVFTLTAQNDDDETIPVPVAAYSRLLCTIRKKRALAQPDDTDADVVAQISLVSNAQGVISVVSSNQVQIVVHSSVVRTWDLAEYFWDLEGILTADGESYILVKGTLLLAWNATRTPAP